MSVPLQYLGEGAFTAPRGFAKNCDKQFVVGEILPWEIAHPRSRKSHNHFFALVAEAWTNLPESLAPEFPSSEHLRKRALINCGYCTMTQIVCGDNKEAIKTAALMQTMDSYALCNLEGRVLTVYRPNSQSVPAMGGKVFQESKDKVLTEISRMVGFDIMNAERAAA